ncbi:MAG: CheR family methyltransferase [Isosphaeraceae bacterium]
MHLSPSTFDNIRKAIHGLCGIVLADDKQYLVVTRLEPVLKRNGLHSYESFVQALQHPDALELREQLIEAITTRETSFNRDGHPFEELRRLILPELASRLLERRAAHNLLVQKARLWCAATATGQEAYSVAMAVHDFLASRPSLGLQLDDFPILASDISMEALAVAREGRYSGAELSRGMTEGQRDRFFRRDDRGWVVNPSLRRAIEFRRLNLVQPLPNLGTFDLILCRNFLIYLDDPTRRRLCRNLHQTLNPGGILIIGAAESIHGLTDAFNSERLGGTVVHRKR